MSDVWGCKSNSAAIKMLSLFSLCCCCHGCVLRGYWIHYPTNYRLSYYRANYLL